MRSNPLPDGRKTAKGDHKDPCKASQTSLLDIDPDANGKYRASSFPLPKGSTGGGGWGMPMPTGRTDGSARYAKLLQI